MGSIGENLKKFEALFEVQFNWKKITDQFGRGQGQRWGELTSYINRVRQKLKYYIHICMW